MENETNYNPCITCPCGWTKDMNADLFNKVQNANKRMRQQPNHLQNINDYKTIVEHVLGILQKLWVILYEDHAAANHNEIDYPLIMVWSEPEFLFIVSVNR